MFDLLMDFLRGLLLWISEPLIVVAFGVVTFIVWYLGKVALLKAQSIRINWLRETVLGVIEDVSAALNRIVRDLQVEFVDEWKRASADGKLTKEEKAQLKVLVMQRLTKTVPMELLSILKANLPDFNGWVESTVNAHVQKLKVEIEGARAAKSISVPLAVEPSGLAS